MRGPCAQNPGKSPTRQQEPQRELASCEATGDVPGKYCLALSSLCLILGRSHGAHPAHGPPSEQVLPVTGRAQPCPLPWPCPVSQPTGFQSSPSCRACQLSCRACQAPHEMFCGTVGSGRGRGRPVWSLTSTAHAGIHGDVILPIWSPLFIRLPLGHPPTHHLAFPDESLLSTQPGSK